MVPGLLRLPASTSRPKSGQIGYQEKEQITGFQKNIGSVESKTGQESGTLDGNAARAISEALPAGRPDSKWDNSGTS